MQESTNRKTCHDCGAHVTGSYCGACGQKYQPLQLPVHLYVREAVIELLGIDGRLWASLKSLLFSPGALTQSYTHGQRTRYLRPLRIYLTATLLFFFLLSLIDPAGSLERQFIDKASVDTTSTAETRYAQIDQRLRSDSARVAEATGGLAARAREADSLSAVLSVVESGSTMSRTDEADSTQRRLGREAARAKARTEEARTRLTEVANETDLRRKRFLWQQEMLSRFPPDSLIIPDNFARASELVFPGDRGGRSGGVGFSTTLPDWAIRSAALKRLVEANTTEELVTAGAEFLRGLLNRLPAAMFLMLPIFALLLKLLFSPSRFLRLTAPVRTLVANIRGRPSRGYPATRHYYTEHLVFGLHTHAFTFLVFSVAVIIQGIGGATLPATIATILLLLSVPAYYVVALKRVYHNGWFKTILKTSLLFAVYAGLVLFGGFVIAFVLAATLG